MSHCLNTLTASLCETVAKPSVKTALLLAALLVLIVSKPVPAMTFSGPGTDWSVGTNWSTSPLTPWDAGTPITEDLTVSSTMNVTSSPTYTSGANSGDPFQVRRVGISGNTVDVQTGGTLDFSGAADTRFLLNNGAGKVYVTGGTLKSTRSNLGGIVLANFSVFQVSAGTVDVVDTGSPASGIQFSSTPASAGAFEVVGSLPTVHLEAIAYNGTPASGGPKFKFVLDSNGVSAIQVDNQVTWSFDTVLQLDNAAGFSDSQVMLFDLDSGSTGTFGTVVADGVTFPAAEDTIISFLSGASYKLTYDYLGQGDIGLKPVPEPASAITLLLGAMALCRRRRS